MKGLRWTFLGIVLTLCAPAQGPLTVQPPRPSTPSDLPRPNLRVDTQLVLVPVTVHDKLNRPVSGLEKENFRVYEDRVEQPILQFAMDDEPVAVGLIFDTSGSMQTKIGRSRQAAREFFQVANPEDEFFLVEFGDTPYLRVPLTANTGEIENRLAFSIAKGSTALLDAIYMGLHEIRKSKKNKKALLIISDGGDNHSRYSMNEVRELVRESDVLIYSIGVFGSFGTPEEAGGPGMLTHISEETGARMFEADVTELPDIARKIGIELRNRYILGYSPKAQPRDGKYHRILVKVIPPRGLPPLRANWRMGYNAPVE
ncbi:MAG: VWA domain-containing protein [Acidobacteriota bacterium]|nr:VWA domain-containing protein [Acidobacteriota bacterium]